MAKCKDCLHYEMCAVRHKDDASLCCYFKDRSRYVVREKCEWATEEDVVYRYGSFIKRRYCTGCGESPKFNRETGKYILTKFCPNCGADMRKGENG